MPTLHKDHDKKRPRPDEANMIDDNKFAVVNNAIPSQIELPCIHNFGNDI